MKLPGQLQAEVAFRAVWLLVAGIVFAGLVAGIVVQTVRIEGFGVWPLKIDGLIAERDEAIAAKAQCALKLETSNASIDTLEQAIADIRERAKERARELGRRREAAEAEARMLSRAAERSDRRIAGLEEYARSAPASGCPVPRELLDQLEGL